MRYEHYHAGLWEVDKVIVDGDRCGRGLQLSHWPGNQTPPHLKADLSTEIALRLVASPDAERQTRGVEVVTNDHFDTDGLLSSWTVLAGAAAVEHRAAMLAACEAGDFYHFTTPAGVQLNLIVEAFEEEGSPLWDEVRDLGETERDQRLYDVLHAELPGLLYDTGRYRRLWEEPYRSLLEEFELARSGVVTVREYPEAFLSVVTSPRPLTAMARNALTPAHRTLEVVETPAGPEYRLHYRMMIWYDLVTRPASPYHALHGAVERLNEMERAPRWRWTGRYEGALASEGPSALPREAVVKVLYETLTALDGEQSAPPA